MTYQFHLEGSRRLRLVRALFGVRPLLLAGFMLAILPWLVSSTTAVSNATGLTPGQRVVRKLPSGGKDSYDVPVNAGQLLQVSIEKGDAALSVVVFDPAGQKSIDYVSHLYEAADLLLPASTSGLYRLEITSLEPGANREYQLTLRPLRQLDARDHLRFSAQEALLSAALLRNEWNERSIRRAIESYQKAADLFLTAGDIRQSAVASIRAGQLYFILAQYREALNQYQRGIAVAKRANLKLEESAARSGIGRLYSYLGDNVKGGALVAEAINSLLLISKGDSETRHAEAEALSNLGEIDYAKGNLLKAKTDFEQSLTLFDEIGDRSGQARVHLFQGYIAGNIGTRDKALAEITAALNLYKETTDKAGEAACLTIQGLSHSLDREEDQAIQLHRQAGEIFRMIGDRYSEATTINGEGQAYEFMNENSMALEKYQQALRLFQENGASDAAAVTIFKIAKIYRLTGDQSQALANYDKGLLLSRTAGKNRLQATILNDIASIQASPKDFEKTVRQYRKSLSFFVAVGDRRGQTEALNSFGDFLSKAGKMYQALRTYEQALAMSKEVKDDGVRVTSLLNVAKINRDLDRLTEAVPYVEQSIGIIEGLRNNVGSPDYRASYFSGVRRHYDLLIDILMKLARQSGDWKYAEKALLVSENSRARALRDLIIAAGADIRQDAPANLLAQEREVRGLIRAQAEYSMQLSMRGGNEAESNEVTRQIHELTSKYQQIDADLRGNNSRFGAEPAPPSMAEIQSKFLEDDSIVLEYALGEEHSYLWAITRDSFASYDLPSRKILETATFELYQLMTARQNKAGVQQAEYVNRVEASERLYPEKAMLLSKILLGPVANQLRSRRIIVVTEGVLQFIPMDALPPPDIDAKASADAGLLPALVTTNEVVNLPSLATLAAIRSEKDRRAQPNKLVAVLADPVFSESDDRVKSDKSRVATIPAVFEQSGLRDIQASNNGDGPTRLAHADEEAEAILAAARGGGMVVKGFDASRENASGSLLGQYKIVHFATHAFLNNQHPEMSGLVFALVKPDGRKTNGFMPLRDIYNLNLSADLVVLSTCDSALGKDLRGEGLIGLTRGFMAAGSKSVVASLWKVDDRSTAVLMEHFYNAVLQDGLTPSAALKYAKEAVRRERGWQSPYFWAGFVLQGEYRNQIVNKKSPGVITPATVVLTLMGLALAVIVFQRVRGRRKLASH